MLIVELEDELKQTRFAQGIMHDTLLIDGDSVHAEQLIQGVRSQNLRIDLVRNTTEAIQRLHTLGYELVIINVSDASQPWLANLDRLQEACRRNSTLTKPLFLCVSSRQWDAHFELEVERKGARYAFER